MCLICKKNNRTEKIGCYHVCKFCKTRISTVIPNNIGIQNILEKHASEYILYDKKSLDSVTNLFRLSLIKKYFESAHTILDFGCGDGNFINFLQAKEYNAFAYDKSKKIKRFLMNRNTPFYINEKSIPDNYFDVITCFDVIEHTAKPEIFIRVLKRKLKKNGIMILTTPNSDGISARILNERWWVFGPTAHFILFSIFSLNLFLKRMDFTILDITTDTITPWFTPSGRFLSKILNKIIYMILFPFQKLLFKNNFGDNIQIVAKPSIGPYKV